MAAVDLAVEAQMARERDHASRLIELLEPAHDLRLLGRQPLGGEHRVDIRFADGPHVVEPTPESDGALRANVASIHVDRTFAGHAHAYERAVREMTAAQDEVSDVTESHDCSLHAVSLSPSLASPTSPEDAGSPGTGARVRSTR